MASLRGGKSVSAPKESIEHPARPEEIVEADQLEGLQWLNTRLYAIAKRNEARAVHAEAAAIEAEASAIEIRANAILLKIGERLGVNETHNSEVRDEKLVFVRRP